MSCATRSVPRQVIPVILDTDPGLGIYKNGKPRDVDDAFAIVQALNSPKLEVAGITIVFGNSEADQGFEVAERLVRLKGADIPVVKGAAGPAGSREKVEITPASEFMARELRKRKLTIVAIGPLTNVASVIVNFPEAARNIDQVIAVMGRSPGQRFFLGGRGPLRDFNHVKDPVSTSVVAESGIPMILAPFEVSSTVAVTREDLEQIREHGTRVSEYLYNEALPWHDFWKQEFPGDKGFHPWDSVTICRLIRPELLASEPRGYRFRMVTDPPQEAVHEGAGEKAEQQSWFELSSKFPAVVRHTYCHSFTAGGKRKFLRSIVEETH